MHEESKGCYLLPYKMLLQNHLMPPKDMGLVYDPSFIVSARGPVYFSCDALRSRSPVVREPVVLLMNIHDAQSRTWIQIAGSKPFVVVGE
jgi:hypothetical protein